MALSRREDWSQRLDAAINAARTVPFGYAPGENHCCLFMGDCVIAMTDTDVMHWFRGKYNSERGAYVAVKRHAGGGLVQTFEKIAEEFGIEEIPVQYASPGDVVMHIAGDDGSEGCGISLGSRFVTVCKPAGVKFEPMTTAIRAWRI